MPRPSRLGKIPLFADSGARRSAEYLSEGLGMFSARLLLQDNLFDLSASSTGLVLTVRSFVDLRESFAFREPNILLLLRFAKGSGGSCEAIPVVSVGGKRVLVCFWMSCQADEAIKL